MVKRAGKWLVGAIGSTLVMAVVALIFGGFVYFLGAVWTPFWMSWPAWAHLVYPAIFVGLYAFALIWRGAEILVEEIRDWR